MDKETIKCCDMMNLSEHLEYLKKSPKLIYLFLELTNCCNLNCLHCGSGCGDVVKTHMDTQMLLDTLDTIKEDFVGHYPMICLSGGEPMLHPDFFQVIKRINELEFAWGMTTNGTLIDSEAASLLKEQKIGTITLSIDGLEHTHDALRQVHGAWKKSVDAAYRLKEKKIPVQITTVIHKNNIYELDAMFDLMCRIGVQSWRVINIEPIGRALDNQSLLLSNEQFDYLIDFIKRKRYSKETKMDVRFGCSHYLSLEHEREVRDNYFICGSGIMVGSILCNGDIYSCLDIERRPELIQGNVKKDRFSVIWKNGFQAFREDRSEKNEECRNCRDRKFCKGDSGHTWDYTQNKPMFCIMRKGNYYELD